MNFSCIWWKNGGTIGNSKKHFHYDYEGKEKGNENICCVETKPKINSHVIVISISPYDDSCTKMWVISMKKLDSLLIQLPAVGKQTKQLKQSQSLEWSSKCLFHKLNLSSEFWILNTHTKLIFDVGKIVLHSIGYGENPR